MDQPTNWGNPFHQANLKDNDYRLLVTTKPLDTLITQATYPTKDSKLKVADFTFVTEPLLIRCRYQPDKDTGNKNILYIKSNVRDETGYTPPTSENLQIFGFPLWLLTFGWLDWIRKANIVVHLDRNYTIIIKSDQINPTLDYYLPLDEDFLNDKSPYESESHVVTDSDSINWFPQVTFQHQTLEHFTQTGPGIAKLGSKKSVEAKLEYRFYFKWGGCPPKMEKITDPTTLPVYPVPNNNESIYSLQNPEINPSTFLYNFDVRQDIITKQLQKDLKRLPNCNNFIYRCRRKTATPCCPQPGGNPNIIGGRGGLGKRRGDTTHQTQPAQKKAKTDTAQTPPTNEPSVKYQN